jgi:hypothetical protein
MAWCPTEKQPRLNFAPTRCPVYAVTSTLSFTSNENYRRAMSSPSNAAEMHTAGASDRTPANYQQAFNLAIPKPSLEHSFRLCCDLEAVRSLGEGVHGDGGQQVPLPTSKNNPLLPSR